MTGPPRWHKVWHWVPVALSVAAVFTVIPIRSRLPVTWDNIQFTLALEHYDVVLHQPHPPGYFLFVMLGRLLRPLFADPYQALVVVAIVAGSLAVVLTYYAGAVMFNRWVGVIAALLLLTAPSAWSMRSTGLTYSFGALFSALVGVLSWRTVNERSFPWWPSAIAIGVAAGFRQTDALFLMPLWLWSLHKRDWRTFAGSLAVFGMTILAWAVPMLQASGGYAVYNNTVPRLAFRQ